MGSDTASLFSPSALAAEAPLDDRGSRVRLWREPELLIVKIDGDVDDEGSVRWRGAVDRHIAERGWARLMMLDVHDALAVNSVGMRFKSASWAKMVLANIEQGVIFTGTNQRSSFVIRTILRFAGMPNVALLGDEAAFRGALEGYRRGVALGDVAVREVRRARA